MSHMGASTFKELEKIVFIPEEEASCWEWIAGWEVTWIELAEEDAQETKLDWWSKDTRWRYCSSNTSIWNRWWSLSNILHMLSFRSIVRGNINRRLWLVKRRKTMFMITCIHNMIRMIAEGAKPWTFTTIRIHSIPKTCLHQMHSPKC